MQETWVQSLGWEDPLEEDMATHSNILAWRIPMDPGAWWATGHEVAKRRTQFSNIVHDIDDDDVSLLSFLSFIF